MINLPNYQTIETIHESENSLVYRAKSQSNNKFVILKILKQVYPPPQRIAQFCREYELTNELNLSGTVKVYRLVETGDRRWAMIVEDFGGQSLKKIAQNQKLTLDQFLSLGIKVSQILGQVHQKQVIHKDINPSNIVWNRQTDELKIIDFGISTKLSRETTAFGNPNLLEGTLAYISPEQTGRMNREIDYRSDFYSLGVTFYELLLGQRPFESGDAMELVHSHIAKQPVPPCQKNSAIPAAISNIVMKLMAKTAEERYQSAWGLKADLETCLQQLQKGGQIAEFPLGSRDISDKFQIPQKLYGRQEQVEQLLASFDRVSAGTAEMMLVAGYSGIGKSALVNEIHKPITRQKGYFISGKFDQLKRDIPYAALIQAFQELIEQLLTESETQLQLWKEKLSDALGSNGQVIADVIPEIEPIIGKQPAVSQLGPTESQNRFNLVFQKFLDVFARKESPLVIFIDDLQWADLASLKLLELLMADSDRQYLLLVAAYRDNEVTPAHPFIQTLERIQEQETAVNTITLEPLGIDWVNQLIADTLKCPPEESQPLAKLAYEKTQGNPFFLNQLLQSLYEENQLSFAPSSGRWYWDLEALQAVGIADNVVDLMVGKIEKLEKGTQKVLKLASCIGNQFDLAILSVVSGASMSETAADLWPALEQGFIRPLSDAYKLPILENEAAETSPVFVPYKFLHDRVQQAAYTLIPEGQKQQVHLRIGQLLLQETSPETIWEKIFAIVNQLNMGSLLIELPQKREELARLNLLAGRRAKLSIAYSSADRYFAKGMELLRSDSWSSQYQLTSDLYWERAETLYLNGKFEDSERLIKIALPQTKSTLEKAKIYNLQIVLYTMMGDYENAIEVGRDALSLLSVKMMQGNAKEELEAESNAVKAQLGKRSILSLVDAPLMVDPTMKMVVKLLSNLGACAYFIDHNLYDWIGVKIVSLSLEYGHLEESARGYYIYAIFLVSSSQDYQGGYQFGMLAFQLSEKLNSQSQKCKACNGLNHLTHWVKPIKNSLQTIDEGLQAGLESGELQFAGYILMHKLYLPFSGGAVLSGILDESHKSLQFCQKINNKVAADTIIGMQLAASNLTGLTENYLSFDIENQKEIEYLFACQSRNSFYSICRYLILKSQIFYLYERPNDALRCIMEAEQLLSFIAGNISIAEHNFYYSLCLALLYDGFSQEQQTLCMKQLSTNQKQMKIWADNCPENFLHKYLLVAAEISRISGDSEATIEHYQLAIAGAKANEYIQEEALGNELAAKFYLNLGQKKVARTYMMDARYCYFRWGAVAKVKHLEENYPQLCQFPGFDSSAVTPTKSITTADFTQTSIVEALDLATVMKASQAIAGEIVLDRLLTQLMKIAIENAGAEKGYLLLGSQTGDRLQWTIEAEGRIGTEEVATLQSQPIDNKKTPLVSTAIVNYVARTQENVVLADASNKRQFTDDPYIIATKPKSILCTPLVNQGKLSGILYLENNLIAGAFTKERTQILQVLSSQAAIAIDNARLYNKLEEKVELRTAQLADATRKAEAASEAKSTFLANMSHELRTPLNAILGFSQLLSRSQKLGREEQENVEIVARSGEHLLALINQVLDLSKIEAGRVTLNPKNFDLYGLLEDTEDLLGLKASQKGLHLIYDRAPGTPRYINTDEMKLRQVLINLINNAIKFTRVGGVEVRVRQKAEYSTKIELEFEVIDSGVGIAPEELDRLFEAFVQTAAGKESQEGTGLGLPISRKFVQLMGGALLVNSQVGRGTTFKFNIEATLAKEADVESKQPARLAIALAPNQPRYRILVADENIIDRQLLIKLLLPFGFEIRDASNGREAVDIYTQWQADLIFMDLRMPVMDGYEATRQIKAAAGEKACPVVAVTASFLEEEKAVVWSAGCDDFIRKPLKDGEIIEAIARHLGAEFIYEDLGETALNEEEVLTARGLAQVPMELLAALEEGLFTVEREGIQEAIDAITDTAPVVARQLESLVNSFAYQDILDLIEESRSTNN